MDGSSQDPHAGRDKGPCGAGGVHGWQASLEPPWAFRKRRWTETGSQAPGGCAIKGNISRQGERIYHTPWGDRFYERTRIDEGRGERWFCSEKEAAEAGFRAPLLR
jgi:hypothetical protein